MSEVVQEKKKFTQSAVLFSLTGHIFIRGDADNEYYFKTVEQIKSGAVEQHVMSSVPKGIRNSLWEVYDESTLDINPILKRYLCLKLPELELVVDKISTLTVREATRYLENEFLTNDDIELEQITFDEFMAIAEEVRQELEKRAILSNSLQ